MEEELRVDKREVVTGKINVRTVVESFQKMARATLEGEQIEVTRVPSGKELKSIPEQRTEGDDHPGRGISATCVERGGSPSTTQNNRRCRGSSLFAETTQ